MDQTRDRILRLIASAPTLDDAARYVVEELITLPTYWWVGVYWRDDDELVLGPWAGPAPTEHTRIAIGEGICGAAAKSGRTEIVADVEEDERYLACFPDTRAEIVVPIKVGEDVVGEIDADGTEIAAFDQSDANVLEELAAALARFHAEVGGPDLRSAPDDGEESAPAFYTSED